MGGDSQASNFIYFLNVFHSASRGSFWRRHLWFDLVFAINLIVMVSVHPPRGQHGPASLGEVPRQAEARAVAAATTRGRLLGSQLIPQQLHQPAPGCPRWQHGLQGGSSQPSAHRDSTRHFPAPKVPATPTPH